MNLGLISLIALLAAIVIGFVRKANVGILCIGFSMILGLVYGIKAGDIIKGFSSSLCMQMIGITYLFAIINENGTLELLAKKMVALVGPHKALIPFVMYLLGFLICAVGPGAIPSLAIVPVIAIPVAISAGVNPIMTAIIGDLGVMSGRMSPLTPESAVVRELMEAQGLAGNTVPIMMCLNSRAGPFRARSFSSYSCVPATISRTPASPSRRGRLRPKPQKSRRATSRRRRPRPQRARSRWRSP